MGIILRNGKFVLTNNTFSFPASTEPCAGVDCSGNPSILLTIFDADYVGPSITWCGETWTQQEVRDGATKCVCPTIYLLLTATNGGGATTTYTFARRERWLYGASLIIRRSFFKNSVPSPGYYYLYRDLDVRIRTNAPATFIDNRDRSSHFSAYSLISTTNLITATLGIFDPNNNAFLPTKSDYRILDAQFGTVIKSGISYTHSKGDGW